MLLEKKGTKLYGLAPMPFFVFLYHKSLVQAEAAEVVSIAVKAAVLKQVTGSAKLITSATAGHSAAGVSGKGAALVEKGTRVAGKGTQLIGKGISLAGKGTLTKVAAGVAAAGLAVGGAAVVHNSARTLDSKMARAYLQRYEELVQNYGEPSIDYSEDTLDKSFMTGLCGATLFDFDQDGVDEILFVYQNGKLDGVEIEHEYSETDEPKAHERYSPLRNGYSFEVLSWKDNELVTVCSKDSVGAYLSPSKANSFDNNDNLYTFDNDTISFLDIVEMQDGKTAIRILNGAEKRKELTWNYLTWDGEEVRELNLKYSNGQYFADENNISEDEWMEDYRISKILYSSQYTDDTFFGKMINEYGFTEFDIDKTLANTQQTIDVLQGKAKYTQKSADSDYIMLYEEVLRACMVLDCVTNRTQMNDYAMANALLGLSEYDPNSTAWGDDVLIHNFEYSLIDIDKDGMPELIIRDYPMEAATFFMVYTVEHGKLVQLTHPVGAAHTTLYSNGKNLLRYESTSGGPGGYFIDKTFERIEPDKEFPENVGDLLFSEYMPITICKAEDSGLLYRVSMGEEE